MDRSQTGTSQFRDTYTGQNAGSTTAAVTSNSVSRQIELLKTDISGLAQAVAGLTKQKLGETLDAAQDKTARKADQLSAAIRDEPVKSAAIAAGAGFILGLLMLR